MAVMPNDPPFPLWVLNKVPDSRGPLGFGKAIRSQLTQVPLRLLPLAYLFYAQEEFAPSSFIVRAGVVILFGSSALESLFGALGTWQAKRWLDRNDGWAAVARLPLDPNPPVKNNIPLWVPVVVGLAFATAFLVWAVYQK